MQCHLSIVSKFLAEELTKIMMILLVGDNKFIRWPHTVP